MPMHTPPVTELVKPVLAFGPQMIKTVSCEVCRA